MRLSAASYSTLPSTIFKPRYKRENLEIGIVHLGIGAFHRAHQAVYTDDVLNRNPGPWLISGVSLRRPDTRDALVPQNGLYTLAIRDASEERLRIIGSVTEILVAPESPQAVLDRLCHPSTKIVSLTITEKGYCHDPATGNLNTEHPDIRHDLTHPERPRSALGFIVAAISFRKAANLSAFTVLSCDNLPSNGDTIAKLLQQFATLRDKALGSWIHSHIPCPNSMVDRIVPATTDDDRMVIDHAMGLSDSWPVVTEPFSQWVIEDRFASGRPAWEKEGVQFTKDVRPFELMKLRLLNGSHSSLAYLGYLSGFDKVADAMNSPIADFIKELMDKEIAPTLPPIDGIDLTRYKVALRERFYNSALKHRTWQIAMDGSQKLPQRLLETIRDRLRDGASIQYLSLGVSAWMRYVYGQDEHGRKIDVRDPMAAEFARISAKTGPNAQSLAHELLALRSIFGEDLPQNRIFTDQVTVYLQKLFTHGALAIVRSFF
ncbi:MAG: mannitol dehydrogenase family protein [Alphaproteobacteria bacterium]